VRLACFTGLRLYRLFWEGKEEELRVYYSTINTKEDPEVEELWLEFEVIYWYICICIYISLQAALLIRIPAVMLDHS
jgi:hypothetical protein